MKIIYIKRKMILNIFIALIIIMISILYTIGLGRDAISTYLNNEKMTPIYSVDLPDKRVALTFDVTWGDQYTQDILGILKRYNIKATFFVTGAWADKYPEAVKNIDIEGNEIGNHSTTHVKMTELSKDKIKLEVKDTEARIKRLTGKNTKLFRMPFGEYNNRVITTVRGINYNIIQWDVDSEDWKGISQQQIINTVYTKTNSGSIVLFHNSISNTTKVLPEIIEKLRKEGYRFITVSELLLKENYYIDNTGRQKSLK